jgi:arylsulfatase A-like enzyme
MGVDDNPRPGIDYWVSVKGQGSYLDREFNVNGRREIKQGCFTDILNVEDGVANIFKTLENQKQLDNTLIIFTSDEGYFYGEHGLSRERWLAYEESIRVPLFMRWPKLIRAGSSVDHFALNIGIAPTLLEIAGASTPKEIQGRSLVPLCAVSRLHGAIRS